MTQIRHDWTQAEIKTLFESPFIELMFRAQTIHRAHFDPNKIQLATLLSIKTGRCPEDCAYCPQSAHYNTGLEKEPLMNIDDILEKAKRAKANGATRFCMGAAWRSPPKKAMPELLKIIKAVNALDLETCVTAGMLADEQVKELEAAGLDYYNHNLDTSPEYYKKIIQTRSYQDRLDTLERVRKSKIKTCCGGIIGMGETREDRIALLHQLATLSEHPGSVPINQLIPIPGTPLSDQKKTDTIEFVRMIATARILMPKAFVRLSAGREAMSQEMQALCFMAGANSIFYGEVLLTANNADVSSDQNMFKNLGLEAMEVNK